MSEWDGSAKYRGFPMADGGPGPAGLYIETLPPKFEDAGADLMVKARGFYAAAAVRFVTALLTHAAGGFVDAVFGELAHHKASVFRVAHSTVADLGVYLHPAPERSCDWVDSATGEPIAAPVDLGPVKREIWLRAPKAVKAGEKLMITIGPGANFGITVSDGQRDEDLPAVGVRTLQWCDNGDGTFTEHPAHEVCDVCDVCAEDPAPGKEGVMLDVPQFRVSWSSWATSTEVRTEKIHDSIDAAAEHVAGLRSMEAPHGPRRCFRHVWNIKLEVRRVSAWEEMPAVSVSVP